MEGGFRLPATGSGLGRLAGAVGALGQGVRAPPQIAAFEEKAQGTHPGEGNGASPRPGASGFRPHRIVPVLPSERDRAKGVRAAGADERGEGLARRVVVGRRDDRGVGMAC